MSRGQSSKIHNFNEDFKNLKAAWWFQPHLKNMCQ